MSSRSEDQQHRRFVEASIVLMLFDLVNHLTKNGRAMAEVSDLTVQQWNLLLQVAADQSFPQVDGRRLREAEVTASAIAEARGVSRASVSAQVSALVRRGMLEQSDGPQDRRRKCLLITESGRAAIKRIESARRRSNAHLFEDCATAELESLLGELGNWLERLWHARRSTPSGEAEGSQAGTKAATGRN
jgi:DNA-binding MarR family transcriptional regulator